MLFCLKIIFGQNLFKPSSFLLINAANVYLFIIVFDAIYMSLPLHVLCSKIEITKINLVYSHVSRDFARFLVFNLGLWLKICWCVLCCIHHMLGAKRLNILVCTYPA